jgi:hypothetical protein
MIKSPGRKRHMIQCHSYSYKYKTPRLSRPARHALSPFLRSSFVSYKLQHLSVEMTSPELALVGHRSPSSRQPINPTMNDPSFFRCNRPFMQQPLPTINDYTPNKKSTVRPHPPSRTQQGQMPTNQKDTSISRKSQLLSCRLRTPRQTRKMLSSMCVSYSHR